MNVRFQLIGLLLELLCGLFFAVCLVLDFWSNQDPVGTAVTHTYGLWNKCSMRERERGGISSSSTCTSYSEIFMTLPPFIKSTRGFGITSLVFWLFAVITGICGLFCHHIPSLFQPIIRLKNNRSPRISMFTFGVFDSSDAYSNEFNTLISTKRFFGILSGLAILISGVFFFTAVMTWWFYMIHDFDATYDKLSPYLGLRKPSSPDEIVMKVDVGFLLGMVSSILSFLAGFLIISGSVFRKNDHLKHILRNGQEEREATVMDNQDLSTRRNSLNEDFIDEDYIPSIEVRSANDSNYDGADYVRVHPNNQIMRMSFENEQL